MTRPFVAAALAAALISLRLSLAQPPKGKDKKVWPADALNPDKIGGKELADAGDGDPNKAPVELVAVQTGVPQKGYNCAAFSPDGKYLVMGTQDGRVVAWDIRPNTLNGVAAHKGRVWDVRFNANGKVYATTGSDGKICVRAVNGAGGRDYASKGGDYTTLAYSPDGKAVITGCNSILKLHNLIDPAKEFGLKDGEFSVTAVAYAPDGKSVVAGSFEGNEGRVRFWDTATGKVIGELDKPGRPTHSLDYNPDGTLLASTHHYRNFIQLWNPVSGQIVRKLDKHTATAPRGLFGEGRPDYFDRRGPDGAGLEPANR